MCLSESIVQCYLDHELSTEMRDRITVHINSCPMCRVAFTKAKEEATLVESALALEMTLQVPTDRLWARIEAAILAASN